MVSSRAVSRNSIPMYRYRAHTGHSITEVDLVHLRRRRSCVRESLMNVVVYLMDSTRKSPFATIFVWLGFYVSTIPRLNLNRSQSHILPSPPPKTNMLLSWMFAVWNCLLGDTFSLLMIYQSIYIPKRSLLLRVEKFTIINLRRYHNMNIFKHIVTIPTPIVDNLIILVELRRMTYRYFLS